MNKLFAKILAGILALLPTLIVTAEEVHKGVKTGQLKKETVVQGITGLLAGIGQVASIKEITPSLIAASEAAISGTVDVLTETGVINKGKEKP